ncbi:MAG TPA: DNA polymerase III subunit alpha, partial [Gemmataceae bacterium]|nr:DNA polymerase III subunit alpha [Gemmataceae bacterium]
AGINPIIGYEAYVAPGKRGEREAKKRGEAGYHLTLLAKNATGFKNLIKMASSAYLEGYYYIPRIDKELLADHHEGLICLSGCASSEFSEMILKEQMEEAKKLCGWFAQMFGRDFYVEVQNNGIDVQRLCAEGAIDIANQMGLPLVATSDAHYLTREDAPAHDVLLCINTGKTLNDPNRMRYGNNDGRMIDQFYVCAPDEMYRRFPELPDAVRRSQEIADGVDIQLNLKARHFPVFTPPAGKTPEDHLRDLCEKGLRQRYGDNPSQAVHDRLEHELDVICRMGFASYFLIVWDFVNFAVENGIPCSARGSGCGALVSYVLKLSHVDPLEHDLLFERFLDPNRSEAPDIDIDFCQERREEVIAYVKRKYGEESVAQIGTFGTLAARAAIKDVGRVLDVPLDRVNQLTNMVPKTLHITLDEALEQSAELKQAYQSDQAVRELIDIARKLEGTNRNAGTHAAGVVIANGPLSDYVPLQRVVRKGEDSGSRSGEAVVTTQWVMGDLETVGLLKMDFLGLRTLTLLDKAVRLIEKTRGEKIDVYKLPLDDPETYQLLQRGDAKGVFQFESDGIRELLKRLRPDNIRDIIACTALYRPGPLGGGMVDAYINCKHGREKPAYAHPIMEEILAETYGVMVYQESVMRILNRLGGIELSSAYACIKAISKKKQEIIDARRADFIHGAQERGVRKEVAEDIFAKIVYFGGYGFNKSHSCAYAYVTYQTAYLKTHYRPEFMAALLSSEIEDGNKRDVMVDHLADARKMGVEVLPPDVNVSDSEFTVHNSKIAFGLTAIKGVGRSSSEEIVRARKAEDGFKDIFDFCERVDLKIISKATVERLIKAGALDGLGDHRAQLMQALPRAIQAAMDRQRDERLGQRNLFAGFAAEDSAVAEPKETLPDVPAWTETDKLKYEKEVLDFYLSSHPLAQNEKLLARYRSHNAEEMRQLAADQETTLAGMFTQIALKNTQKARNGNSRYFLARIEDMTGSAKCVMWPDDFARFKEEIRDDVPYIIKGTVDRRREEPTLVINRILTLEQAQRELARGLYLLLRLGRTQPGDIDRLGAVLRQTPGPCPVFLTIKDGGDKFCVLKLGRDFAINPNTIPQEELEAILGPNSVRLM